MKDKSQIADIDRSIYDIRDEMCIRDSEKVTTGEELNKIKDKHSPGDTLKLEVYKYATGKTETVAVSYTHRDVYKRQVRR